MTNLLLKLFVKDYKNTSDINVRKKYGLLGSFFGLITNLIVFIMKLVLGLITKTSSIIADSLNNLSDFGNNFISIFGFKLASKKADDEHPYGHQRLEQIVSLILGCIIVFLGLLLLYDGITNLISFITTLINTSKIETEEIKTNVFIVTTILLSFSILIKILQSYLYFSLSKKINSLQLKALGKDSRNDVVATIAVLAGLLISYFTTYKVDCFFTIVVSIFVTISGINIIKEAIIILIGKKPDKELINKIINIVDTEKNVLNKHDLIVHSYGNLYFGSIDIEVDNTMSLLDAHEIADSIEKKVFEETNIRFLVHIDPIDINNKKIINSILEKVLLPINKNILLHDFQYHKKNNLITFDLVIPANINTEKIQNKIKNDVFSFLKKEYNPTISLQIAFDDSSFNLINNKN